MNYRYLSQIFHTTTQSISNDPFQLSIALLTAIILIFLLLYVLIKSTQKNKQLKYEFITIIAHKFRTPLSQIKWSLEEIIPSEQEPYIKESMQNIQESNEKLIELTSTLIELTNSSGKTKLSYHFEQINLYKLVYDCGENLKKFFHEKNLYFSVQAIEKDILVRASPNHLEFVIQTLMENAGTYSPPGRNIEIVVSRNKRKALVTVTDHGIGMARFDMARLFSKFYRAKAARSYDTEGFGVGLYLSQSIMRHHHGKIEAFSKGKDQGSTFTVSMPVVRGK